MVGQNNDLGKPTFVIIDELDRCRPNYAVEMLEAVKHIFDITGVYFIIATDTEQLQHAIKVVYGEEFDAQTYLSRFFDSRFSLRETSLKTLIEAHCDVTVFKMEYCVAKGIYFWPYSTNHLDNLISIFDTFKLSPRVAIQVVNRISATIINMKMHTSIDICYLAILHSIRIVEPNFYNNLVSIGRLGDYNSIFKGKDYFHSDNKISITTDLSQGPVEMSLSKYFETIFLYVSNIFENHAGIKFSVDGLTAREIQNDLDSEKSISRRSIHDESFHARILQFEYLQSSVRKINKKSYKDMVELAVSFD
ncbi:KAP family P-loop NTPase fold protein [Aeromonas dhakensis]|uniref:KAP family P-loop NTPase fold protein n=1 Tax=Aeromonas dhakensis TaxID=196024 RepID=UPI003EC60CF8